MSKKMKLIPELRFHEFVNDGVWKIETINELCEILNNIRKPITSTNRKAGKYPYYGASGIIDYIDDYLFQERLLLIGEDGAKWGAFENTAFLVDGKYWVNNHAHVLKPIRIDDKLLESYLVKLDLQPYITGAAPPKLTLRKLKEIPVPVPNKPQEQQKIASCLSSLDELIAAHSDKLEALKDHKKGLMQNLFPQKGQKVPNYRFLEFEKDGEWVERRLKKVFSIFQGFAFSSNDSISSGTKWLKIADVGIQQMKHDIPSYLPATFKEQHQKFLLKKGDYVIALTRPILNMELKIAPVDDTYHNALLNQRVGKLVSSNNVDFVYYLLQTKKLVESINKNIAGSEPPNLSFKQIASINILIPKNLEEQQKIVSCLSALDELVTAQSERIKQLQQHKKGLMQGLFPKINR